MIHRPYGGARSNAPPAARRRHEMKGQPMTIVRAVLCGFALALVAACASPPAAQVDETRTPRVVIDPKTQLESGRR